MTFFNKKEDVMSIELTPHGRRLLRDGKLNPQYYAFFDDDVLYDSQRLTNGSGLAENNSKTKARILSNTPSLKPQTNYKGIESTFENKTSPESENALINPIGTNKSSETKSSGWNVTAIRGEISSSTSYISSSNSPMYNVPQIECEINYTASIEDYNNIESNLLQDMEISEIALDNTFIQLKKEQLLFYILEKNGFSYKDSLSVEVFLYEQNQQSLEALKFSRRRNEIQNDLLIDELPENADTGYETKNIYVENYFNLSFDNDIYEGDICKGLTKLRNDNIYLGLDLECADLVEPEVNIYQTEVIDLEDCE